MKKNTGRAAAFLNGKGFYVVLFLCIAAIGISAYVVYLTGRVTDGQLDGEFTGVDLDDFLQNDEDGSDDLLSSLDLESKPEEDGADDVSAPVDSIPAESVEEDDTAMAEETIPVKEVDEPEVDPFFVMPVDGDAVAVFSAGELVYNDTLGDWRTHNGVDFAGELGDTVCAMADGTVEKIYTDPQLGVCVLVAHGGNYKSLYANLQQGVVVKEGEKIHSGTVLGGIGSTAAFEALMEPHVHVEVMHDGKYVDPLALVEQPWAEPIMVEVDE